MTRPDWAPEHIDITRASVARVYDYALGGAHNFAVDREAAELVTQAMPELREVLRGNRVFLTRAVHHLLKLGIRQFLDLGSGIPTVGNVHEIAHKAAPDARVVYVDNDPVAVAHSQALLADHPNATVVGADLTDPAKVIGSPEVQELIDFSQPVGVLIVSVLHFLPDEANPIGVVRQYMDATVPGSHLALSHAHRGEERPAGMDRALSEYSSNVQKMHARTHDGILAIFGDLELLPARLVPVDVWGPEGPLGDPEVKLPQLAGVAVKA
ncbi:SAM-dependent methyltransferase [Embleya sp. NBC_00896]|uniref:SAM-dependent methyltransferase n=1 Tax=Embleya sp. NBC_00896 TaxID=2975961 RepID=UPI003869204C|nr:SAM-dependent methyltransferase [Embleya sp. NBC_00896]